MRVEYGITYEISLSPASRFAVKQLLSAEEIRTGVARLAADITAGAKDQPLTIVGVLTGSLVVLADLIRELSVPLRVGLIEESDYGEGQSVAANSELSACLLPDLQGRHVVILDDIYDTGHTLSAIATQIRTHKPSTLRSAVFLRKENRREVEIEPDYVAFEIPNLFVVGYGLDYNDQYRHLPYVAALEDADFVENKD